MTGLKILYENFEKASTIREDSSGKQKVDPNVYLGTGGISYALLRATAAEEAASGSGEEVKAEEGSEEEINAGTLRGKFEESLTLNKQVVKKDKNGRHENNCASFFMAASIGNFTIEVLDQVQKLARLPEETPEEVEVKSKRLTDICAQVKSKVIFAGSHCLDEYNDPEDEILYGSAGYLQVLLLLRRTVGQQNHVLLQAPEALKKYEAFCGEVE